MYTAICAAGAMPLMLPNVRSVSFRGTTPAFPAAVLAVCEPCPAASRQEVAYCGCARDATEEGGSSVEIDI